jgi:hypothetical protein
LPAHGIARGDPLVAQASGGRRDPFLQCRARPSAGSVDDEIVAPRRVVK